jgi:uncharacterized cupredoxin-like copper-binding protein
MKHEYRLFLSTFALLTSVVAHAHGDSHLEAATRKFNPSQVEATAFGQEGDPAKVTRTIRITMDDKMRFVPGTLTVQKGETVRLRVTNRGAVLHELVIGTPKELAEHAEIMRKFPGMEHDAPHMAHVKPGRNGEIVWQFTQPGEFQFACLIPGHFEAGMVGKVVVK